VVLTAGERLGCSMLCALVSITPWVVCTVRHERGAVSSIAEGSVADEPEQTQSQPLIGKGMLVLFVALICCFTAWGVAQDLTTPMVAGFKRIFDMSTFQASLVQLAYFGAYFLLALPAAFINQRFGYKTGILTCAASTSHGCRPTSERPRRRSGPHRCCCRWPTARR
jgi:hypothetical protein